MTRAIAVALHDVEPATYERCALIRDWLGDLGIDKVTLLVIPASDLHPFQDRRPELLDWLGERVRAGDTVAQHGFQHRQQRRAPLPRRVLAGWPHAGAAEFVGLDEDEARRAVDAGRRLLRLSGIEPRGFVAPAYAYTSALSRVLAAGSFDWWASLHRLWSDHGRRSHRAPALTLGTSSRLRRDASPAVLRARALLSGPLLRLDVHPADLDHPGHVHAVEGVLRRAHRRTALTYDELLAPA